MMYNPGFAPRAAKMFQHSLTNLRHGVTSYILCPIASHASNCRNLTQAVCKRRLAIEQTELRSVVTQPHHKWSKLIINRTEETFASKLLRTSNHRMVHAANNYSKMHMCQQWCHNTVQRLLVRSFSTCHSHFAQEQRKSKTVFQREKSTRQSYSGRGIGRNSKNSDESTLFFTSPQISRLQDRTRQNIKGKVSRLKSRMLNHNRYLQEKLSAQRIRGTTVVRKWRKRLLVKKENIKTIPNLLTTLRMTSAPILAYLVVNDHFQLAFSVFLLAGLTDMLDGYIARNFKNQKSALGTALDPLADKLLMCFLTLSLTAADLIPVPMTALILSRDAGLILASFYIRYISLAPPRTLSRYFDVSHVTAKLYPSNISKVNTALQLLYVASTLASPVFDYVNHPLLQGLMYVTATTTFLSGADYMITWRRRLKIIKNN